MDKDKDLVVGVCMERDIGGCKREGWAVEEELGGHREREWSGSKHQDLARLCRVGPIVGSDVVVCGDSHSNLGGEVECRGAGGCEGEGGHCDVVSDVGKGVRHTSSRARDGGGRGVGVCGCGDGPSEG